MLKHILKLKSDRGATIAVLSQGSGHVLGEWSAKYWRCLCSSGPEPFSVAKIVLIVIRVDVNQVPRKWRAVEGLAIMSHTCCGAGNLSHPGGCG